MKATNVDGVYDDNPRNNPDARLQDNLTYHDVISKELSVMDLTAITLCQENNIPGTRFPTLVSLTFLWMIPDVSLTSLSLLIKC